MLETPPHVPIKEQKFLYSLRFSKSLINITLQFFKEP